MSKFRSGPGLQLAPVELSEARTVGLVLTGGTVGSQTTSENDVSLVQLQSAGDPPELTALLRDVSRERKLAFRTSRPLGLLSENVTPNDWLAVAGACRDLQADGVDSILVLHGTDTMAFTAAFLSFALSDLQVPVVLTGSNIPPGEAGSDAAKNIDDALRALQVLPLGVFISFAGAPGLDSRIYLGTRTRKLRASGAAFTAPNGALAGAVKDGHVKLTGLRADPSPVSGALDAVDDRVLALQAYPGLNLRQFQSIVDDGSVKGVVLELYASWTGNELPGPGSVPEFVARCATRGVPIFATVAAPPAGEIHPYPSSNAIKAAGATPLGDMTTETATVKLMWALAQMNSGKSVEQLMQRVIANELTID
jgi:L-asparaginase/Glu-tRNA(Gln) amidotransferase subunit D